MQDRTDIVERLRSPEVFLDVGGMISPVAYAAATEIEDLRASNDAAWEANERLNNEVASLRLTLGGRTFSADVPEPVGCPLPGACQTVEEIRRLRAEVERLRGAGPRGKEVW